jgi:hypothetical protein
MSEQCKHEFDGGCWVKFGDGWAVVQVCHKCGHREYSHHVGVT